MSDIDWKITIENFNNGMSPAAHIDQDTFIAEKGQATSMLADVISKPGFITQSPALSDLVNGNESGVIADLIRYILDKPVSSLITYALGESTFYKLSPTTVQDGDGWPKTISGMTEGESLVKLNNNLYGFYNKSTGGDIFRMPVPAQLQKRNAGTAASDSSYGNHEWTPNTTLSADIAAQDDDVCNCEPDATTASEYLKITNFGFSIPSTATIKGITVFMYKDVDVGGGGNVVDDRVRIVKGGTIMTIEDKAKTSVWPYGQYVAYGGELDLWGTTWTPSDINNSNFGVVISASVSEVNPIAKIDHCFIIVNYEDDDDADGEVIIDWGSFTDQLLENAPHPSASKEDIMVFGNGRYLGVYVEGQGVLDTQKLDFGKGAEVVDVVYTANNWWIAVNSGEGKRSQIYVYDGSATSNLLSDEAGVGDLSIGFLYVLNGIVYVAYEDKSSDGFIIGYLSGRQIKPLRYYSGSLPNHRQKALYKNTILFVSDESIWSSGATIEQLPFQISALCDAGYEVVGALASPFGVPIVASYDNDTSYRIAKFSGYSLESTWESSYMDITQDRRLGKITDVIVYTKLLGANAQCDMSIKGNQGLVTSNTLTITGEEKIIHLFRTIMLQSLSDFKVLLNWANGNQTNDCPIRKIVITGVYVEQ